jgi:hypothetical protein
MTKPLNRPSLNIKAVNGQPWRSQRRKPERKGSSQCNSTKADTPVSTVQDWPTPPKTVVEDSNKPSLPGDGAANPIVVEPGSGESTVYIMLLFDELGLGPH